MTAPTTRETADHADHIGDATTMIDHAELAACPFCGGKAVLRDGMGEFWVRCDDCGASGSMRSRQDRAVRDWSVRPSEAALLSEIAALRDYGRDVAKEALEYRRQRDELRKALERIADEAPYRSGYCQSDVDYAPKLSDKEMQAVAQAALSSIEAEGA